MPWASPSAFASLSGRSVVTVAPSTPPFGTRASPSSRIRTSSAVTIAIESELLIGIHRSGGRGTPRARAAVGRARESAAAAAAGAAGCAPRPGRCGRSRSAFRR